MADSENTPVPAPVPRGFGRRMLKLLVVVDSSRFTRTRMGAALILVALLLAFAGIGYGLPALLARHF